MSNGVFFLDDLKSQDKDGIFSATHSFYIRIERVELWQIFNIYTIFSIRWLFLSVYILSLIEPVQFLSFHVNQLIGISWQKSFTTS